MMAAAAQISENGRLVDRLPSVRGRLTADAPLDRVTWFRFHQDGLHGRRGVEMEEDLEKDWEIMDIHGNSREIHGKFMGKSW